MQHFSRGEGCGTCGPYRGWVWFVQHFSRGGGRGTCGPYRGRRERWHFHSCRRVTFAGIFWSRFGRKVNNKTNGSNNYSWKQIFSIVRKNLIYIYYVLIKNSIESVPIMKNIKTTI